MKVRMKFEDAASGIDEVRFSREEDVIGCVEAAELFIQHLPWTPALITGRMINLYSEEDLEYAIESLDSDQRLLLRDVVIKAINAAWVCDVPTDSKEKQ